MLRIQSLLLYHSVDFRAFASLIRPKATANNSLWIRSRPTKLQWIIAKLQRIGAQRAYRACPCIPDTFDCDLRTEYSTKNRPYQANLNQPLTRAIRNHNDHRPTLYHSRSGPLSIFLWQQRG